MIYYTSKKNGQMVQVTEKARAKLIKLGLKKPEDFLTEAEYNEGNIQPEPNPTEGINLSLINRDYDKKIELLNYLSPIYSGDISDIIDFVAKGGKKPQGLSRSQEDLFGVVYNTLNADGIEQAYDKIEKLEDNPYSTFIKNTIDRKNLYTNAVIDSNGKKVFEFREPTGKEVLLPNYESRKSKKASALSKGIGLYHDITTLPTRAITAGIAELTPYSDNLSFGGQMGRTVEASTGPENLVDFGVSSVPAGYGIVKGAGKLASSLKKADTFHDVVRDVEGTLKSGKRVVGEAALKGAGEGAAYSAAPSAVMATSPDEKNPLRTFGEGLGLGAVTGAGIGAAVGGSKLASAVKEGRFSSNELTPYTDELLNKGSSLKRLQKAIGREPVKDAKMIEDEYRKMLDETRDVIGTKIGAEREADLKKIEDMINTPVKTRSKPSQPVDDIDVTYTRDRDFPEDYTDADYSNPPDVDVLPDYTPEDFNKLVTAINNERNELITKSNQAIKIKGSNAYKKMSPKEKRGIDQSIITDTEQKMFDDVDKAISTGDIEAITDALGKSTVYIESIDPHEIALGMRSPLIEEPIIPGGPRKYKERWGIYKESPKSLQEDVVPDIIPDEDALYGITDEARTVETPVSQPNIYKHTTINFPEIITSPEFNERALTTYLNELPVDATEFASKEWNRVRSNLAKKQFSPKTIIDEVTRLNKLGSVTNDNIKKGIYKDLASKLREAENDISNLYLNPDKFRGGDVSDVGLPAQRSEFDRMYNVLDRLPQPSKIIQESKSRLTPGTSSKFKDLVHTEQDLNKLRSTYDLPDVDILTSPVAANVRSMKAPTDIGSQEMMTAIAKAGRGPIVGAVEEAARFGKGYAKEAVKGGYAPAVLSETEFEYPEQTGIPIDILTKGGSSRVLLKTSPKKWKSVEDIE